MAQPLGIQQNKRVNNPNFMELTFSRDKDKIAVVQLLSLQLALYAMNQVRQASPVLCNIS